MLLNSALMKQLWWIVFVVLLTSCVAQQQKYNPAKKFSAGQLQQDFQLFRNILEESHPSLYWFTPKDSIDHYFEIAKSKLKDSLTEAQFRTVLSYVVSKFRCGHTSVRASKAASGATETNRNRMFPLNIKAWDDTVVVTSNINRKDSTVLRGVVLKSIDGRPMQKIIDSIFQHLSNDGYNLTHKYQTVSNFGVFRDMYSSLYGVKQKMQVEYIDSTGKLRSVQMSAYNAAADTPRARTEPPRDIPRRERKRLILQSARSLRIDTALQTAFLEVNTFGKHMKLRSFFRQSFRKMKKENIQHLVVDMRGNGGGSVTLSNLLTKYLVQQPFKIADTLYAIKRKSSYRKYQEDYIWNRLFMIFLTRKGRDGNYHFRMYENKYFKPKESRRFNNDVYILTGGNTFSAAVLFSKAVKAQTNVTIVGEETGGGAYGNTAWLIPDVTLPNTKVRFRLPLFRLVIDKNEVKGRGLTPEVESKPTVEAIRKSIDFKIQKALEIIKTKRAAALQQ
jgi:hypothetical protein